LRGKLERLPPNRINSSLVHAEHSRLPAETPDD
jgi:hypothetical protein